MVIQKALNETLKLMWALDEKISSGEIISKGEMDFWNKNLRVISDYYQDKKRYWQGKKVLQTV